MTLRSLISEFLRSEQALERAIRRDGTARELAELLRRSALALDRVEGHDPVTPEEAREQILFFMRRAADHRSEATADRDIRTVLALSARAAREFGGNWLDNLAERGRSSAAGLIDYVRSLPDRASILDRSYHVVAISPANAAFYGTEPEKLAGTHVAELIGEERFQNEARPRLDACMAGAPQEYYHALDTRDGRRIIRCQMKPAPLPDDTTGALVYVQDMTDRLPIEVDLRK